MTEFRTKVLGEMSWTEARDAARQNPVVLLPIGAIEQHGPHLPIQEDSIVAEWVAHRVSEQTSALVAPALHYGHSPMFRGFTGNLSLSAETLKSATYDIIKALTESGFPRIVIVNNNGGNVGPVSSAAYDARRDLGVLVGHVYPWSLGYALMRDQYEDPAAVYGHGSEPEHSAMLAMFPDQVRPTKSEGREKLASAAGWTPTNYTEAAIPGQPINGTVFWDFSEISVSGCTGDPTVADAELGKIWVERVVGFCTAYVNEFDRNTAGNLRSELAEAN
ncbi:creatininase family protein [Mycolicibacterium goodii]|uniref:creatininase family protein n=1 Tax=Mycolicibacterium goodii TaxID=134601 RepID=UPI000C264561|nr:creatininase family protein [Mycolicibacterium goodii]PJK18209.1 hypothetical protein CSX11_32325 [Mycolicibacterium goodii]